MRKMPAQDAGQTAHRESVAPTAIDPTSMAIDEARAATQLFATEDIDDRRTDGNDGAEFGGFIAVIESHTFIAECIRRSVQSAFALPVLTYPTAAELEQRHLLASAQLIIFS